MKLGHLTCILLQIGCFLPNITPIHAQNQQMYIRTTDAVAHQEDKTAPERRTTSTLSDNHPPITNIQKDSVKNSDSTPVSVQLGASRIVRDVKTQANEAHLIDIVNYRAIVPIQTSAFLKISPNPMTDVATMTIAYEGVPMLADCYLTDVTGKVLWQKQIQITSKVTLETLIINELSRGFYVMRIQIGNTFLIQKIVKE